MTTSPLPSAARPLSFAQEQLWFLDQLQDGGSIDYLLSATLRMHGPLDVRALTRTLATIADRHTVLRSCYDERDGEIVQLELPDCPLPMTVLELIDVPSDEHGDRIQELRLRDLRTSIDLRSQPPWRITLLRLSPDDAQLLITVHHIAFDGLSWSILADEMAELYGAFVADAPSLLARPGMQYHDAASRQRAIPPDRLAQQLEFWRQQLAGLTPLELPTDRSRPMTWDPTGDYVEFRVPVGLAQRVREICRTNAVTPFMVYLAAYQLLLARYAGQTDVGVGVSVSNRRPDERQLIGMFLNTLVLRADLSAGPSFAELLKQVGQTAIAAFANQDVPFDQVAACFTEQQDRSRNPLFQAGIAWYDARRRPHRLPGIEVSTVDPIWASSAFDLSLHLAQTSDGSVKAQLVFPTSLFDRSRIERMAANYLGILSQAVARPNVPTTVLELVSEEERQQLLHWGLHSADRPDPLLPELFRTQVRCTPDATALITDDEELSYRELADRVDALTGYLHRLGVGVETPVGVAVERSSELIVAVLGVLAAGASYVPLPPDHPAERLGQVIASAGVGLILTQAALAHRLPDSIDHLVLDRDWPAVAGAGAVTPQPTLRDANIAYIVHTSGSTGRPKGVAITHAGIRNRVLWSVDQQLRATDRVLQKTTIGFDAAVWELLAPLTAGATVVMAPVDAHRDPAVLVEAIRKHDATVLQLVPSVLRLLVGEPALAGCRSLRLVCSAGEALPAELCRHLIELLDVEVYNTYGPTECSIDATAQRYLPDIGPAATIPIGVPLPNVGCYVVDPSDRLVPIGVPGELCLGGVGLARGYLGRPELTAGQFTPHPYAEAAGQRWYRTGDRARWLPDGRLEYLGRTDHQFKINGVRVEPGEIEAVLCEHREVSAAAVVVQQVNSGERVLVGYVQPAADAGLQPAELREYLERRLPAPMVPSTITLLAALPLGPNGKLDRAALPAFDPRQDATSHRAAPLTPTEHSVAAIVAEVLGVDQVDPVDDFFCLGGHSLLAIRLVLKLRRTFGVAMAIGDLFADRTVEAIAARIDSVNTSADLPAIQPAPRTDGLPLSFGQQRLWFLDQLDPQSLEYVIPQGIRLRGPLDLDVLRQALDQLVDRHEVLRTRYLQQAGVPTQWVDPTGSAEVTVIDLTGELDAGNRAQQLLTGAANRPFQLEHEHSLRTTVIRIAPDEHLIALTLHHIAFDAWSLDILLRDLHEGYQAILAGRPAPARPPIQYADYSAWQRGKQSGQLLAAELEYWRTQLADLDPVELVTDRPRPARRDPSGNTLAVDVPQPVADAVAELANRHGATPFMLLFAAFAVLLRRYTGKTDISVGTPVAGRSRPEAEELVGFFTNTLVLRADLAGEPSFGQVLRQVRDTVLAAFAHQDVPFEHLVDALQPERDLARNPLFQIMFELQHLERHPRNVGSSTLELIGTGGPVAKFDLTMSVQQRADGRLRCVLEYATSLFDRSSMQRLAEHYLNLLASLAADPEARITELELIGEQERRQLLNAWSDPEAARLASLDPAEEHQLCVPELIQRQVAARPDALAAVFGDQQLSYADLDARSDRLALLLRTLGAGPEVVVGSCLERSLDAIVVLLAVLKAGAAYAPFDPRNPAERLRFMMADADVRIVVTSRLFADQLGEQPGEHGRRLVLIDERWDHAVPDMAVLDVRPRPRNLAYVIYTSGSTGQPKGVLIEHRSYAHHCRVIADAYGLGPDERVVLLSALTFDVAMDQIAATLIAGATIVVGDPVFWTPVELPARLAEFRVTIMEITPAYYREVMRYGAGRLTALKLMNVGSDVVTAADAQQWYATGLPGRFLCNYGPTEATVTCFLHPMPAEAAAQSAGGTLPIGRPVAGTRAYILDADLQLTPAGVAGELCLGGARLARGYHARPALTADRFVPDPFAASPGERLYRTGDLVRHLPDGTVEFLGRIDQQVKIRGLRIELGEIEAALLRLAAVREAAVVTIPGPSGDRQIGAYLVCQPGAEPSVADLRGELRALLPDYMVPSLWTMLERLPVTSSGKLDRKALPAPSQPAAADIPVPPRNPTEQAIAEIWQQVLSRDQIGVRDDFFALGGHSLLVTRVLAQLRSAFAVDIPLRRLFEATTVAELADEVTRAVEEDIAQLSDAQVAELLSREVADQEQQIGR